MKKIAILICCLTIIIISCSKNITGSKPVQITNTNLNGTWILIQKSGGFAGETTVPTKKTTLTFQIPQTYSTTYNNQPGDNGIFTITKSDLNYYNSDTLLSLISANDNQTLIYGIHLKTDSLFLSEGCCDRFDYTYVRQK